MACRYLHAAINWSTVKKLDRAELSLHQGNSPPRMAESD